MPTRETEANAGLGEAAKHVAERASALVRLELELAALELKRKVLALALGVAFTLVAGIMLLFALGFAIAGGAAGLATAVSTWLALLLVAGGLVLLAGLLGLLGLRKLKRGTPPVPEQAIEEARLTTEALRGNGGA
jgi:hypothetical protein